jgi:hypothetical protein
MARGNFRRGVADTVVMRKKSKNFTWVAAAILLMVSTARCPGELELPAPDARQGDAAVEGFNDDAAKDADEGAPVGEGGVVGDGSEGLEAAGCGPAGPQVVPGSGCGAHESDMGDICGASSGGSVSFRFFTTHDCAAEAACSVVSPLPATFEAQEGVSTDDHHLVLLRSPGGEEAVCDVSCRCPEDGSLWPLRTGIAVFVGEDLGLRITEVFIDPVGVEPDQEFVEVFNVTGYPLDVGGWRLSDAPPPACGTPDECATLLESWGDAVAEGTVIPAGVPVLLVPSGFDARDPSDVPAPPGCLIFRLDESLGERGLRNSGGEPVYIVDRGGAVASFYPNAFPSPVEGTSVERVELFYPDGDVENWIENPGAASTPCAWGI